MRKKRSESYIVTDQSNFIPLPILNEYAIKSAKGLNDEDGFNYADVVEPPAPPRLLNKLLDINTWHKVCCEAIAADSSGAGYTFIPRPDVQDPSPSEREYLEEFFRGLRPNINKLLYEREYDCESLGWGLLEIIRETGSWDAPICDIKHYSAANFRRCADGVRVQQRIGTKTRWFVIFGENFDEDGRHYDVHYLTGEKYYEGLPEHLRANELLWKNRFNPETKLYGKAPASPSIASMYADHSRSKYNIQFFKNYGIPAMVVTITGDFDTGILDPTDPDYDPRNTLQYRITEQLKEVIRNPHSAMVIQVPSEGADGNVDVRIEPLSVETKEASFRLFRKDNRDEIIAAHHMDPNRVGVTDAGKLGSSNAEQTDNSYRVTTIKPLVRENEDDINYLIHECLLIKDWDFKIIDTDEKKNAVEVEKVIALVNAAIMTPNEAREAVGEAYGIARIDGNPVLDDFYYNGSSLAGNNTNFNSMGIGGVDSILAGLENDLTLMGDDDPETREEETSDQIDTRFKNAIKGIRRSL